MIKGFLNIPYFAWTAIALVIAGIFVYIWPHKAVTTGFRYFIIHWGHALTWLLLAVSFSRSVRGTGPELNGGASLIALAGGVMYLLFMLMAFVVK